MVSHRRTKGCTMCSRHYPLIFMDISMPVLNGYQAASKIREFDKDSHIIGLTAHSTESYKSQCFQSGMNSYSKPPPIIAIVAKPIDERQLD